jgi:hypothetical protein
MAQHNLRPTNIVRRFLFMRRHLNNLMGNSENQHLEKIITKKHS